VSDADNLEIKKRARRRLVGAAALALLAAILLPVMMDQEPRPTGQDIQVSIPDRGNVPPPRAALSREPQPEPEIPPVPEEAPATSQPEPLPTPANPVAPPPPQASVKPPVQTPSTPPAANRGDEAARVQAILSGGQAAAQQPAAVESYVLQVGAFGDAAKAGGLSADLKKQGYAAYTERAGNVTRVRVGPFTKKDEAEKVAARLKAQGQNAVLAPR